MCACADSKVHRQRTVGGKQISNVGLSLISISVYPSAHMSSILVTSIHSNVINI